MFGSVFLIVITLVHLYSFWRLAYTPLVVRFIPRAILLSAGVALWLTFILARSWAHHGQGPLAAVIESIGMNWAAVLFLIFSCLLVADVVTGFGFLWPKRAALIRNAAVVAGLGMAAIGFIQGMRAPVVETYEVRLPGLPSNLDGKTIVALSDLHLGAQIGAGWLAERVAQVQALKPDMIILLGDVFDEHGTADPEWLKLLKGLSAPLGKWAVLGNHEYYGAQALGERPLIEAGFQVLRDRSVDIGPGLILTGMDDISLQTRFGGIWEKKIKPALRNRPPGPNILLSHTPLEPELLVKAGVNLMLSGHTHGGQIWPLGYISRLRYPFLAGRYEVGGMTVIVSRGAGTWGPRMRLWKPGDIVRVILRAE